MKRLKFKEVIENIKHGEVWESCAFDNLNEISINKAGTLEFNFIDKSREMTGVNIEQSLYKLKRKEVSFQEAFKAYEEGKEIESLVEGQKFKKIGAGDYYFDFDKEQYIHLEWDRDIFSITCIRGEWYIND